MEESQARREADLRSEESVRLQVRLRAQERRTLLAAALQTLDIYRGGILVQSDATIRSTMSQYQVGKVTFPSVLEVLRGLVVDEGGYLDALAAAQKLAIADREVSLAPPDGIGSGSGGSMPGAASVSTAGRAGGAGGSPQPAAVPAATGACLPECSSTGEPTMSDTKIPASSRRFGAGTLVVVLAAGLGARRRGGLPARPRSAGATTTRAASAEAKTRYTCPMHPTIVSDHPGDCPICGMALVKVGGASGAAGGERKIAFYRSPMDAKQTSPVPRKDEMGMDYLPVYEDEASGAASPVEGLATVNIDPQRQQLIGLRTVEATRGPVGASWSTVGKVAVDETNVHHVNIKVGGFVDTVYVDYVGKPVKRGERLFSIYSPDLLSVQQEYLLALRTRKALAGGGVATGAGDDLVESARERLRLWDIPESEVKRLEETGKPTKNLTMYSPMTGVVTKKDIVMGHRLNEGDMPYEITDLARVWVLADAYETDLVANQAGHDRPRSPCRPSRTRPSRGRSSSSTPSSTRRPAPPRCASSSRTRRASSSPRCSAR